MQLKESDCQKRHALKLTISELKLQEHAQGYETVPESSVITQSEPGTDFQYKTSNHVNFYPIMCSFSYLILLSAANLCSP